MKRKLFFALVLLWSILAMDFCLAQHNKISKQAQNIYGAAQKLYDEGHYQKAVDTVENAIILFEKINDNIGLIRSLNLKGENMANLNQCDKAITILNRSMQVAETTLPDDHPELAQSHYFLSRAFGGCARKFDEAIPLMQKSIRMKRKIHGEGIEVAFDYTFMGYMLYSQGQFDSASVFLDKALQIREKNLPPDDVETSNTLYHLGRLYEQRSELSLALEFHLRSFKIRKRKLDPAHASISNSLHQIGFVYQNMGNFDRALEYYHQALGIRRKSLGEDHANVASSYFTIGNLYGSMFNYRQAIHYIKQGNAIIEKRYGDKSDILPTYEAYLGRMYGHIGDHKNAATCLEKALMMAEKNLKGDHPYLAIVYNIVGDYYADINGSQKAAQYFNKALAIFKKAYGTNSVREADVLSKTGAIHAKNRNYKQAREHYMAALKIYQAKTGIQNPKVASMYQAVGDVAKDQMRFSEALAAYQKAFIAVTENFSDTTELVNPALAQINNKPMALRIASTKAEVLYRSSKSDIHDISRLKQALRTYQFSIALVDEIASGYTLENARAELEIESRKIYNGAMKTAYLLYTLTNDKDFISDAFAIVEKSRSAILLDNIRDNRAKTLAGVPDSLIVQERDIKIVLAYHRSRQHEAQLKKAQDKIPAIEKDIFLAQQRYEELKKKLETLYPAYFNYKYSSAVPSLMSAQQFLPDETTAIIEFFVGDSAIYITTIRKNSAHLSKVVKDEKFEQLITSYEKGLTDASFILSQRKEADLLYTRSAHTLYELLLKYSLEDREKKITKLIIIPDDFLAQFNFGTLLCNSVSEAEPFKYAKLDYLARHCTVSYAYSVSFIKDLNTKSRPANNLFAGFAPSYKSSYFSALDSAKHPLAYLTVRNGNLPLPGAEKEVTSISDFMNGDSWIDNEATETNFKQYAGDYDILHLAMHSLLNNDDPHYSELLFSAENDNQNDGFLNVAEIYNLRLNASMVVLSACSSGFGKVQKGEGPISISRAFSYAGCPSVIMSLWKIPDEVTSQIMTHFYEFLKNGKQKDEALRLAQIKFLDQTQDPLYQHPYFWAGFVVMGDATSIPEKFPVWKVYVILIVAAIVMLAIFVRVKKRSQSVTSADQEVQQQLHV